MPTKPQKPSDKKELIAHIRQTLEGHEEAYVPGAWENFTARKSRKNGMRYWLPISGIAAGFLIIAGLYFYNPTPIILNPTSEFGSNEESGAEPVQTLPENSIGATESLAQPTNGQSGIDPVYSPNTTETELPNIHSFDPKAVPTRPAEVLSDQVQESRTVKEITLDEFLAKENQGKDNSDDKILIANKWNLGVVIAPSMGSSKELNMGYGLSVAYRLSNKLSLNSGVSYNELAAGRNVESYADLAYASPGTGSVASSSKNLQSVNARYTGIDIPLELKYHLSNRLYANLGVSAFAIVSKQHENTFVESRIEQRGAISPDGQTRIQNYLVTENITESSNTAADNQHLIGFYNFSFGYKQKISQQKSIAIEPFMKLPMKGVTNDNLKLMGTGIKIRYDF